MMLPFKYPLNVMHEVEEALCMFGCAASIRRIEVLTCQCINATVMHQMCNDAF